jgi:hypothetical protein
MKSANTGAFRQLKINPRNNFKIKRLVLCKNSYDPRLLEQVPVLAGTEGAVDEGRLQHLAHHGHEDHAEDNRAADHHHQRHLVGPVGGNVRGLDANLGMDPPFTHGCQILEGSLKPVRGIIAGTLIMIYVIQTNCWK